MPGMSQPAPRRGRARARDAAASAVWLVPVLFVATACATETSSASAPPAVATASESPSPEPPPARTPAPPPPPLTGRTVVLDPGHNRDNFAHPAEINRPVDAGGFTKQCNTTGTATDSGIPEATINWEIALLVRDRLAALGATVVLTRDADAGWGPCIDERAAIANAARADLFLSVHGDGAAASSRGFHVITPGSRPGWTDDIEAESARAATAVRDALVAAGLPTSNYRGQDGIDVRTDLGTLNRADVPAVMLEAGNLRNATDAALLTSPEGRRLVADALAAAVLSFAGS
jgi:N-acetylmuramoyl-L-alanine amidase